MKFDTQTLVIIGLLGIGAWYFFVKKKPEEKEPAAPPPGVAAGPGAYPTETQQALIGTAGIIEASGSALGNVLSQIWPD